MVYYYIVYRAFNISFMTTSIIIYHYTCGREGIIESSVHADLCSTTGIEAVPYYIDLCSETASLHAHSFNSSLNTTLHVATKF